MAPMSGSHESVSIEPFMFELHPRLSQDCIQLGRFPLCRLLLMNENRYPWFILVPEREELSEIYQLTDEDQVQLMRESSHLSRTLSELFRADKMNIAAIGNLVPQLHLHHVVRYRGDPAWPGPIWGRFDPLPYDAPTIMEIRRKLGAAPLQHFVFFD
ncbi:HIT domain-containing protein [Methylocaldum gracile]|uniref:HIT domain-containing protein n=2 Tax=unclassified Methylocaldum TaxID=2622260 RepID=UPI003DA01B9E